VRVERELARPTTGEPITVVCQCVQVCVRLLCPTSASLILGFLGLKTR